MSQRDRFRELDARIHSKFARSGLAETATYTPAAFGGVPATVSCYVDRELGTAGAFDSRVQQNHVRVTVLAEGLAARPARGDQITLGADTFKVDVIERADESLFALLCKEGD